jgi:site-specific DNA-adenine methylase
MEVSKLIRNVTFEVASFETSLNIENDSGINLAYLDPPYAPENDKSFTKYTKNDFTLQNHEMLFKLCDSLKIPFIMSNSNVDIIREHFGNNKYSMETIECKRSINSKDPGSKTMEVLIFRKAIFENNQK